MSRDPPAPFHPTATRRVRGSVRVGVGVIVCQGHKIYAGLRKGSHGTGKLALPGGHLELYESWEDCAIREVMEEMNVHISGVRFVHVCNNPMPDEEKHNVTIFMMARINDDAIAPVNTEPEKCEGWNLYSWNELREMMDADKVFSPLECLVREAPAALLEFLHKVNSR
ncbi:hypothetical protein MPSEU_000982900 [Mayamaea pseudoterrestris]|nr:hypothetical protein MPSEU_000982900 [Mayamaea pseudoterrestris]